MCVSGFQTVCEVLDFSLSPINIEISQRTTTNELFYSRYCYHNSIMAQCNYSWGWYIYLLNMYLLLLYFLVLFSYSDKRFLLSYSIIVLRASCQRIFCVCWVKECKKMDGIKFGNIILTWKTRFYRISEADASKFNEKMFSCYYMASNVCNWFIFQMHYSVVAVTKWLIYGNNSWDHLWMNEWLFLPTHRFIKTFSLK